MNGGSSTCVLSSHLFSVPLTVVYPIGTPKGQADGFEIDFLVKLNDTKNATNSLTLLQYVAKVGIYIFSLCVSLC
jgi:hypothetical protein